MNKLRIEDAIDLYNKNHKTSINKKQLAERIMYKNYSVATLQSYISTAISGNGKVIPIEILKQLSIVLEISSDYLLGLSDSNNTIELSCKKFSRSIDKLKSDKDELFKTFF